MQSLRKLIGCPVFSFDSKRLGEVQDVCLDIGEAAVTGFIVSSPQESGGGTSGWAVRYADAMMDREAVIIGEEVSVAQLFDTNADSLGGHLLTKLLDKAVFTENGENLGEVDDVLYNPGDGKVAGYEVSAGILADLVKGRVLRSINGIRKIAQDRIIVAER